MSMTGYQFLKPLTFENKGITLKNRVVIPPMTERMSFEDGVVTRDEIAYYAQRAGGAGMFITGTAGVNQESKGFEGQLSIADDKFIPRLSELAAAMKRGGTKAIIQIFSAGRMTNSKILRGQQPVSASAIAAPRPGYETPRPLTNDEILQTIKDFGEATRRAIQAGFDGVEIHGANTYLIQQFFSPHSNQRDDDWGGSLEKRIKFPLEVVHEVESAIDQYAETPFILGYRISPEELENPGITLDDTLTLIEALKQTKIDYLHVSQSNVWRTPLRDKSSTVVVNDVIKTAVAGAFPIIVVGGIRTPAEAEKAAKQYDMVALGHELLWEPKWVQKVERGDEEAIRYQVSQSDLADLGITPTMLEMIGLTTGGIDNIPFTIPYQS